VSSWLQGRRDSGEDEVDAAHEFGAVVVLAQLRREAQTSSTPE
jgi:hypothetical protein